MSRAILIRETGQPDVLRPSEIPTPEPAAGEILIRNHTGAVNFIDTIIRRGKMPEGLMPALPHVPGVEGAGVIEALGQGVEDFVVGDRVAWTGPSGPADREYGGVQAGESGIPHRTPSYGLIPSVGKNRCRASLAPGFGRLGHG